LNQIKSKLLGMGWLVIGSRICKYFPTVTFFSSGKSTKD